MAEIERARSDRTRLYLAGSLDGCDRLRLQGLSAATTTRKGSQTFPQGGGRGLVQPLLRPWRWRRLLLNEGVEHLAVGSLRRSGSVVLGAVLAGVSLSRESPR